ncbi:hypothetical protein CCR95_14330 [Thiocystis minor]|uniref:hypothetical protein n=1 Tax=Thiocystis minor TaxID=61597 RepID=UPI0019139F4F|nr:hypothetical protein [Thiocystis minor]MBK5965233.1 hypothetical protein [Thiocystis minor]
MPPIPAASAATIPTPSRVLVTVKQLVAVQPALSEGGVRWDLFNRDINGLTKIGAIFRRGRRILIDPEAYLRWLETRIERVG